MIDSLSEVDLDLDIHNFDYCAEGDEQHSIYFSEVTIKPPNADNYFDESEILAYSGSGQSLSEEIAQISAISESLESCCADNIINPKETVCVPSELNHTYIKPEKIGLYLSSQYSLNNYDEYHSDSPLGWVLGKSLTSNKEVYIPALSVYLNYQPTNYEQVIYQPNSNGLAAGNSLNSAILNGLYEVIERDAFLVTWLNKLPATEIELDEDSVLSPFVSKLKKDGFTIKLYKLITDNMCSVVMCVLSRKVLNWYSTFIGLGADFDPFQAVQKSLLEAIRSVFTQTSELKNLEVQKKITQLSYGNINVEDVEDHGYYYLKRENISEFDFLDGNEGSITLSQIENIFSKGSVDFKLEELTKQIENIRNEVIYVDLSTPEISDVGFYVVRVVVPGYMPMYHGQNNRRLGNKRLINFPTKLINERSPLRPSQLNKNPHPLG